MPTIRERLAKIGLGLPDVLLPASHVEMDKWAVVACDQFSSEKHYWEETAKAVGDAPSTLNLMLPECYLEEGDTEARAKKINDTMRAYLDKGVFRTLSASFVLVDRKTAYVPSRKGLVVAVDLEAYSFEKGAKTYIRPTEGTIISRLPPRMNIRRGAALDMPHILLLIDDPKRTVIEPLYAMRDKMEKLYDFDLVQKGGHISGWAVPEAAMEAAVAGLEKLAEGGFLFAVGDGNHSLAAAKQLWEEKKSQGAPADHSARYALVEVENIHDEGLPFHPIHRVLFGVDRADFFAAMEKKLGGAYRTGNPEAHTHGNQHVVGCVFPGEQGVFEFSCPEKKLTVELFQEFLDDYLAAHKDVVIDYIHGDESVCELAGKPGNAGFFMPHVEKDAFFRRIVEVGTYPRKTFSIGEATEKRYYLEARKLITE